jgi:hypothetical protein
LVQGVEFYISPICNRRALLVSKTLSEWILSNVGGVEGREKREKERGFSASVSGYTVLLREMHKCVSFHKKA